MISMSIAADAFCFFFLPFIDISSRRLMMLSFYAD